MRYLKKLLKILLNYIATYLVFVAILQTLTGYDYSGTYAAVTGVGAVELIVSGIIKITETKQTRKITRKRRMNMKQTIIEKLTSRKLWAAIAAFVATILVAIFENELPPEGAELIKNGVIALCVYIFGEAGVDIARMIWQAKDTVVSDNMSDAQESQMSGNSEVSVIEPETTVSATVAKDTPREAETKSGAAAEGEEDEEDELSCSEIVE